MEPRQRPKITRVTDGVFAAVIRDFLTSPKFKNYAAATQDAWGRELRLASRPDTLGSLSIYIVRPALIQAFIDGLDGRPGKQSNALAALKQLEKWAIVRDLLPYPITTGVETDKSDGGHIPWSDDQVELAEHHAREDIAKAITLAANTGQRGSDLVRLGWADIEKYRGIDGINVTQQKTGKVMWIPITGQLAAAMAGWERRPGPILLRRDETAWGRKSLSQAWMHERDTNPALVSLRRDGGVSIKARSDTGLVLHGLRATACVRLHHGGAHTRQIADMVGMSEELVAHYLRFAVQRENASAAVLILDRTQGERRDREGRRTTT